MTFNTKTIAKILSVITLIVGLAMLLPAGFAILMHETREFQVFMSLSLITCAISLFILYFARPKDTYLHIRDNYLTIALCWLVVSIIGALPYIFTNTTTSIIDAFFISTSSFTTTGATVLKLHTIPKSLMLWEGISNWLGGLGFLVFVISVIPALGVYSKSLSEAEVSIAPSEKVTKSFSESMRYLYSIYIFLTIVEFFLLVLGPMDSFDALINTLSSISTSGISSTYNSLVNYDSAYTEGVICGFSLISSINFSLYYLMLHGDFGAFLRNKEFRFYIILLLAASLLVSGNLFFSNTYDLLHSLRYGFFQTISIASTASFTIGSHISWPSFSLIILVAMMVVGGCSFSTSSGIKISRLLIFTKLIGRGYQKRLHPKSVVAVKITKKAVPAKKVSLITIFIILYILFALLGALILSLDGHSLATTLSTSFCMISNTGVGFDAVSDGDFSIYSAPMKAILCFLMLAGRLELFTILVLFMPSFWNPSKLKNV